MNPKHFLICVDQISEDVLRTNKKKWAINIIQIIKKFAQFSKNKAILPLKFELKQTNYWVDKLSEP